MAKIETIFPNHQHFVYYFHLFVNEQKMRFDKLNLETKDLPLAIENVLNNYPNQVILIFLFKL